MHTQKLPGAIVKEVGENIVKIRVLLGHEHIETTRSYKKLVLQTA